MDDQIIYIEQKDKDNAIDLSRTFAIDETKRRAYVNALGAELAMKYLALENINVSNVSNMHNIHKILQEFDISDVMLPNIHIDVRMVYNEEEIFIPKSHFEYGLTPDIYLVFHVTDNSPFVMFLGFFEPQMINKKNANDKYYFIEKEKLCSPKNLKSYVESFNGNTTQSLNEEELENYRDMAITYIDDNITKEEKENLIKVLSKSAALREELAEFSNFELLSYHTIKNKFFDEFDSLAEVDENTDLTYSEIEPPVDEFDIFDTDDEFDKALAQETIDEDLAGFDLSENDIDNSLLDYEDISEEALTDTQEEEVTEDQTTDETENAEEDIQEETLTDIQEEEITEQVQETDEIENTEEESQEEALTDIQEEEVTETTSQDLQAEENITLNSEVENTDETTVNLDTLKAESTNVVKDVPDNTNNETISLEALQNTTNNTNEASDEISEIDLEDLEEILNNTDEINLEEISFKQQTPTNDNIEKLEILYNEDNKSTDNNIDNKISDIIEEDNKQKATSKVVYKTSAKGKKAIAVLAFIIVTIAGILLYTSVNKDSKTATQENTNVVIPADIENQTIPENNIAENIPTPAPEIVVQPEQIKENITTKIKGTPIDTANISIKKVGWTVPNYLSYNEKFTKYLQTSGKSLKLTLSSDLLLATEYAYSNEIQVNIKLTKDGFLKDINIVKSSGSDQIDKIVLQTVKDILNIVKAPTGVLVEDETNLILKLYL